MEQISETFSKLSAKYDIPVEELAQQYNQIFEEVKSSPFVTGRSEEQISALARNKLIVYVAKSAGGPSTCQWEGIIIGIGDLVDTVAKQIQLSKEAFNVDAAKAFKGTIYGGRLVQTDENGNPVYPDTEVNKKMNRIGKPIPEHSYLRTIYGVGYPIDQKTGKPSPPQMFTMAINGSQAINVSAIPAMKQVKFRAIDKTKEQDMANHMYKINMSSATRFTVAEIKGFPDVETILRDFTGKFITLGEIEVWHAENAEDFNRLMITEGSVTQLNLEPNPKTNNMMMTITDETLMFGTDKTGVLCWVPADRSIEMDFGVESRVFVVGRTTQGKARDPVTKQITDEPGDVMINVIGLYAPELFKVSPDVETITPESVSESKEW